MFAYTIDKCAQLGVNSDVVFIIDDSGSISEIDFNKGLNALTKLMDKINWDTKYAAIKFSTRAQLLFNFVPSHVAAKFLKGTSYSGGMTNTQAALRMARTQLFQNYFSGVRRGSNRIAVVLTDGRSSMYTSQTLPQAKLLKEAAGVTVFVIAIGDYISGIQEIYDIASENDYGEQLWFHLRDIKALEEAIQLIMPHINYRRAIA